MKLLIVHRSPSKAKKLDKQLSTSMTKIQNKDWSKFYDLHYSQHRSSNARVNNIGLRFNLEASS